MAKSQKTKSKSRTSKSNLSKKVHVPIWAIILGIISLVSLGLFFVYSSFASTAGGGAFFCNQGRCVWSSSGVGYGSRYSASQCYYSNRVNTWVCGYGSMKRR